MKNKLVDENYYVLQVNLKNSTNMGLWDWLMPTPPVINNYNNESNKIDNHQEMMNMLAHKAEHMTLTNNILLAIVVIILVLLVVKIGIKLKELHTKKVLKKARVVRASNIRLEEV